MSTTTIPAAVVRELRGSLCNHLIGLSEEIGSIGHEPRNAEQLARWSEPLAVLNRSRALLDRIGWIAREDEPDAEIDLDRYRWTVEHVLGSDLELFRSIARGSTTTDAERENAIAKARAIEEFGESIGLRLDDEHDGHHVTVPDDFADELVETLIGELRQAGAAVEVGPDRDVLERFDAIREVLDAIGWGAGADIDLDLHGYALQRALAGRLALERFMMADAAESVEKGHKGAEQARDRAYGCTLEIERFMDAAGLEIPKAGEPDAQ
jgi:hypothetical protein